MKTNIKGFLYILGLTLIPTILIWLPFFFKLTSFWNIPLTQNGMATIVANYDGPLYIVIAKSLYNPQIIKDLVSFPLPVEYYPAHFPLYALVIKAFSFLFGYPYASLIATLFSSFLAIYFFRKLASMYIKNDTHLAFITFTFAIFPARWLIVRSTASADPLFTASIIASLYFFINKRYFWAGLWGALAQLTKSPAILLFVSYLFYFVSVGFGRYTEQSIFKWVKKIDYRNIIYVFMIPASLIGLFYFYKIQLGSFFAYFKSGDNIHIFFPPFQVFNYSAPWVGTFWLEEIIFVYLLSFLAVVRLIQKKVHPAICIFACLFFTSTLFISHRDIIRYSLPLIPLYTIAYEDILAKKEMKYALLLLIIPIYLFSISYISQNVMPISDWGPLL